MLFADDIRYARDGGRRHGHTEQGPTAIAADGKARRRTRRRILLSDSPTYVRRTGSRARAAVRRRAVTPENGRSCRELTTTGGG
ncbi:hypothetical protein ACFQ2M_36245 [Kitasatospora saccharophila]|uniref:hypothetical protein n=1 Tax=Kitasatospora saccharophila TaxID=407973 RepID=UPI0031DF8415